MSYQVLARKWRPQQFRDMIGQEHVLKALVNALDTDRLHHAYLFTGMRGVGKTTIARIFAKCLNCERADGVTSTPCGECSTCQDIEAGRFFDLIEVDAASRTKVDETRELLENVPYAPTSGRYKVYLIDEVHMFSNHSFNALLKTLEEPPAHVKFLLATTDPQKVPVTVLSRCLQFNLKRMVPSHLADYLETILNEESITHERGALDLIARAADGSVRDSLSLVEQAAAYGEGAVKTGEVESMLGRVSVARLLDVLNALADNDIDQLFARINELAQYAPDFHELLGELLSLTHRIAMLQSVPGSVEPEVTERDQLQALADKVSSEDLQLWYQIGMHARRDMPFAPDPREAFDMAMLRMLAFAPQSGGTFSSNTDSRNTESNTASATAKSPAKPASKSVRKEPAVVTEAPAVESDSIPAAPTSDAPQTSPAPAASSMDHMEQLNAALGRAPKKKVNARANGADAVTKAPVPPPVEPELEPAPAPGPTPGRDEVVQVDQPALPFTHEHWPAIVRRSKLDGLALQLAMNTALDSWQNGVLLLRLPKPAQHLSKPSEITQLAKCLSAYCGDTVKVTIDTTVEPLVTPASLVEKAARQAQEDAEQSIQNDPLLAELLSRVDGEVTQNSVRPIKPPTPLSLDNGENS